MSTHNKKEPKKMNKTEFIAFMTDHSHNHKHASHKTLTKVEAEKALNLVLDSVISAIKSHHNINITGFGSFEIHHRKAREGRNPKTGAKMKIDAYNQPTFRAGRKMKEACN
ncbi:DNA-binding protein HU [Candidatus Rickettsia kotlanii]|nr:DNA-binding protein HU [Candidatus Rickettsia kotlanii]BDU61460.1 DNA-binding protein HU [Candidatus Rickettsia kotlanii]